MRPLRKISHADHPASADDFLFFVFRRGSCRHILVGLVFNSLHALFEFDNAAAYRAHRTRQPVAEEQQHDAGDNEEFNRPGQTKICDQCGHTFDPILES